ncbi:MAG TPA: magnesium chelatase [Candidatus Kapabacteria bacterium]|nr:magnesium chelatase [Candidatus Kapabacteria bacterium]
MKNVQTLGELKTSGYEILSIKEEVRRNLVRKLQNKEPLFPGIVGYEETVIPQLVNALLAKHDIILLGLRGQAKTRLARGLVSLLDEWTPVIVGSEVMDNPFEPISYYGRTQLRELGDETPIEWVHRSERYGEKLATPDVTIADLIGDIDPLKAAAERLHYSHEGAIHFGIIPRTNRGIFTINELPDLQPRIQVGLFNILEERDIQIRGFKIRIPLDVMMIFTANPEDYTNRGSIITPLKDRIAAQIITHYPLDLDHSIAITEQEAWTKRWGEEGLVIPYYFKEIIEQIAVEARGSDWVDQKSGVSARLGISAMETLISNAERRALACGDKIIAPRITDLGSVITGITGKVELVFEGEEEGITTVAKALIGRAVKTVFKKYFPDPLARAKKRGQQSEPERSEYADILSWFAKGNSLSLSDTMSFDAYTSELARVPTLKELAAKHIPIPEADRFSLVSAMEFVLEGLHQHSKISKSDSFGDPRISYGDMVGSIFSGSFTDDDESEESDELV